MNREKLAKILDFENAQASGGATQALKTANDMIKEHGFTWLALLVNDPEDYISKEQIIREWGLNLRKEKMLLEVTVRNQQEEIERLSKKQTVSFVEKEKPENDESIRTMLDYLLENKGAKNIDFIRSLDNGFRKYGNLTYKQEQALRNAFNRAP